MNEIAELILAQNLLSAKGKIYEALAEVKKRKLLEFKKMVAAKMFESKRTPEELDKKAADHRTQMVNLVHASIKAERRMKQAQDYHQDLLDTKGPNHVDTQDWEDQAKSDEKDFKKLDRKAELHDRARLIAQRMRTQMTQGKK